MSVNWLALRLLFSSRSHLLRRLCISLFLVASCFSRFSGPPRLQDSNDWYNEGGEGGPRAKAGLERAGGDMPGIAPLLITIELPAAGCVHRLNTIAALNE